MTSPNASVAASPSGPPAGHASGRAETYDFGNFPAVPAPRAILYLMLGLLAAATLWLSLSQVNVTVQAEGKVVTTENETVLQPLETSVVREITVRPGDAVKRGQVLARLDPTITTADASETAAKLKRLTASIERLTAELGGRPFTARGTDADETLQADIYNYRHQEYAARLDALQRRVEQSRAALAANRAAAPGLSQQVRLARDLAAHYQILFDQQLTARPKLIEAQQQQAEAELKLGANAGEQQRLLKEIAAAEADRDAFRQEWSHNAGEELVKTKTDAEQAHTELAKSLLRSSMIEMTAPFDALVLDLAQRAPGAVLREAEPLVTLVPADGRILAEVMVETRDVARLKVGDPVTLKFEALPWQQYGSADGVLVSLSPDAVVDQQGKSADAGSGSGRPDLSHYRARIEFRQLQLRNVPDDFRLRPGMRLNAAIQVGRRSVLSYLLNPMTRVLSDSLREP